MPLVQMRRLKLSTLSNPKFCNANYSVLRNKKNWAIPQAAHEWVLLLDADERVTPELKQEIQELLALPELEYDAFQIKRRNFFLGKKIRFGGWRGNKVIRLIRRDVCRYKMQSHEELETEGIRLAQLEKKIDHFPFKDTAHFVDKMRQYAEWSAQDRLERTRKVGWFHLWIKPGIRFFKHFFVQLGFLDGKTGFIISSIMAWSVFLRYVKIKEIRQKTTSSS